MSLDSSEWSSQSNSPSHFHLCGIQWRDELHWNLSFWHVKFLHSPSDSSLLSPQSSSPSQRNPRGTQRLLVQLKWSGGHVFSLHSCSSELSPQSSCPSQTCAQAKLWRVRLRVISRDRPQSELYSAVIYLFSNYNMETTLACNFSFIKGILLVDRWMDERKKERKKERKDGWMNEWMNECKNGLMDW